MCVWLAKKVTHSTESRICDCGRSHTRRSLAHQIKPASDHPWNPGAHKSFPAHGRASVCVCACVYLSTRVIFTLKRAARWEPTDWITGCASVISCVEEKCAHKEITARSFVPKVPKNGSGWLWTKILHGAAALHESFHAVNLRINKWLSASAVIKGALLPQEILSKWATQFGLTEGSNHLTQARARVSLFVSWTPDNVACEFVPIRFAELLAQEMR